jgi:beta-N-acetylhexosaminidase
VNIMDAIGQKLLLAFEGKIHLSPEVKTAIRQYQPAGFTLFRALNLDNPAQVRQLTQALQQTARKAGLPLLLIAADQEGGQLMAIGEGSTPLPGNLALGATGSPELARRAGEVLGHELRAMGINVNYAPCCDVNSNPRNPVVGTRSFGEDPDQVAQLAAAMIAGMQSSGLAATAKHFPGHGDTSGDSHYGRTILLHALERLHKVELPPFKASIQMDVKLIMVGHLSLLAVEDGELPATLSAVVMRGLLRDELGYGGVIVTDAMDMKAIRQGEGLGQDAVRAVVAGADLLLLGSNAIDQHRVYASLQQAVRDGQLDASRIAASSERVLALKSWIARQESLPDLSVVGCKEHQTVAVEIAEQSITLVRDQANLLPLRLHASQRLAVIMPRPLDLTPADTSSYVTPVLAQALRAYHADVDEFIISHSPDDGDIAALIQRLPVYDMVIMGTLNAFTQTEQAELVRAVLQTGIPCVVAALRMPYDLAVFPEAPTYVCCYSILEPSMFSLAKALMGRGDFPGRLPVSIPGLYPLGHGQRLS